MRRRPARHRNAAELPQVLAQGGRCPCGFEEAEGGGGVLPGGPRPGRVHGELLEAQDRGVSGQRRLGFCPLPLCSAGIRGG